VYLTSYVAAVRFILSSVDPLACYITLHRWEQLLTLRLLMSLILVVTVNSCFAWALVGNEALVLYFSTPRIRHFSRISLLQLIFIFLMMEAVRTSETSVYSNETTRRYIPDSQTWEPEISHWKCFTEAYFLHRPDDGCSTHLWNTGQRLVDYTEQHPRKQSSSYSLPWEPEISRSTKCRTLFEVYVPSGALLMQPVVQRGWAELLAVVELRFLVSFSENK
jgi:hypothetical protein